MLSFNIRDLLQHAAKVDGTLGPDDPVWLDEDLRPASPIHVSGRLSQAGPDRFYFSGRMEGIATHDCRRCLTDVRTDVADDLNLIFAESAESDDDDPDIFPVDDRMQEIDLRPAIREQWLLSVPRFAVCRDDCRGICPKCGADLNAGPCGCPPESESDSRWEALRAMRSESQ
ncbi:MAG: DUF177 domain-containing protein [Gemmatimonadaceae bacterium]